MTQPEALRIADMLEAGNSGYPSRAAAELRRLHAELERCKQVCAATAEGWRVDAALAEPVQEPVLVVEREPDYWSGGHFHEGSRPHIDPTKVWGLPIGTKLYTTPPQRKPLAEWQISDLMADIDPEDVCSWSFRQGVYAAEKHHGVRP